MQAGALKKRVIFQARETTVDDSGGQSVQWKSIVTVPAEITPTGGREVLASGEVRANSLYTIRVRYYPGITPRNRIVYGDLVLDIVNVADTNELHKELVIIASEGLNRG